MQLLAVFVGAAAVCALVAGDELGTKPLMIDAAANKREKLYRGFVGEQEYHLPFKTRISEALKDGQTIHAAGTIARDPQRIDFNLIRGRDKNADIPLHLSTRFDEGLFSPRKVVYNNFKNGNWSDKEERASSPFVAEGDFDLRVRLVGGEYKVYGNRQEVGSFKARDNLNGVDHVSISGDIERLRIFHYGGQVFPQPYTAIARLTPGKRLDISGVPTDRRFNVNLFRKSLEHALQLSVRFNEKAIVRNAQKNGEWQTEAREGDFSLTKGEVFDLTIINEAHAFQIFVNGKRFCTFAHAGDPQDIQTLEIEGGVELQTVTVNDVDRTPVATAAAGAA